MLRWRWRSGWGLGEEMGTGSVQTNVTLKGNNDFKFCFGSSTATILNLSVSAYPQIEKYL
jgi:hypothetical protein